MSKVKVWGKEIDSCWKCYHHGHTDFDELCCSYTGTVIKSDINEDCPFTKPITKEVIESFGGEVAYIPEAYKEDILFWFNNKKYLVHIHNHDRIVPLLIITDTEKCCNMDVFKGTINNPIELEFILKSIGVIE